MNTVKVGWLIKQQVQYVHRLARCNESTYFVLYNILSVHSKNSAIIVVPVTSYYFLHWLLNMAERRNVYTFIRALRMKQRRI